MANSQTPAAGAELSGNVMFYNQPEPLNPQVHGSLGVNFTDRPFSFVTKTHVVPITVTEFAPCSLSYPVVFVGENKTPLCVMGLRDGENLFVSEDGVFRPDVYIPAFVRRYPFVFAADDKGERFVLCVDRSASFISENAEIPFFEDGQPSQYTQNAMQFCNDFETERRRTEQFVQMLTDLDLFEVKEATFTPPNPDGTAGTPQKLADYYGVSEAKLRALPNDKFLELRDNGALAQIYAHIHSLMGWDKLVAVALNRAAQQTTAVN